MRVCLTVQGEQPIKWATSTMLSGMPRAAPGGPRPGLGGHRNALGSRAFGPGCPVQCPVPHGTRERDEKPRKRAGLRAGPTQAFGVEASLFESGLGRLVIMVVSMGTPEQAGDESSQERWQVHVEVPEESQHQADKHELE